MKYSFLHLSDLHYRSNFQEENGLVFKKFLLDLHEQCSKHNNLYLVFSGDIVKEGKNEQDYNGLLSVISNELDKIGLQKDKRICNPGNHDISQDELKPLIAIQKGTLSQMSNEQLFNDNLAQNSKSFLGCKFENYKKFEADFAAFTTCEQGLGGTGWRLTNNIGIFCLNSALCSYAGLHDLDGKVISDQNNLMIDTRSLHSWLQETDFKLRILVMHHPVYWLAEWAKLELEKIISNNFQLVFSGHIHENSAIYSSKGIGKSIQCVAPPLFTKKSETLGYSITTIDDANDLVSVYYRQWSPINQKFVLGTSLAGNDNGEIIFGSKEPELGIQIKSVVISRNTLETLQSEYDEAITCYSSMKRLWVDRDLANMPETNSDRDGIVMITQNELIENFRSCTIRAPKQYGLTSLGYFLALEYYKCNQQGGVVVTLDISEIQGHRQGVIKYVESRCRELNINPSSIEGFILDNWHSDKKCRVILRELKSEYNNRSIVILESLDDSSQIANAIEMEDEEVVETLYLWALNQSRIRELVVSYLKNSLSLDDNLVTKKIINDIDALNIHRTPHSCLLSLKLIEQAFDESPVNRTEMIGRVLSLLFYQFDKIPRYATRPDLKDCEYALGYFCEWLIRQGKKCFSKNDFYQKVKEYCDLKKLDLDIEVLFVFLATEHIFICKGIECGFRFKYWLYFFAAHRMHHDPDFSEFILENRRYSAFPEIIEFYAGIDRRRSDAVIRLTEDLKNMNTDFLRRTGITETFNPLKNFLWSPNAEILEKLKADVDNSMSESAMPSVVKDAIADKFYDRGKPYNQALASFINETSLIQMVLAMKGAARALRNSDHVTPDLKVHLLEEVLICWTRVCQIIVLLSPILTHQREAAFEGMGFILDKSFDNIESPNERWERIMIAIVDNVVAWYEDDIFSKKMGALLIDYNKNHQGTLQELLVILVMIKQRPPNWEKEVDRFILKEHKNSFYLNKVYYALRCEFQFGFSTEKTRHELKRLAATSLAKHGSGIKQPNKKLIEKASNFIDESPVNKKKSIWRFINPKRKK